MQMLHASIARLPLTPETRQLKRHATIQAFRLVHGLEPCKPAPSPTGLLQGPHGSPDSLVVELPGLVGRPKLVGVWPARWHEPSSTPRALPSAVAGTELFSERSRGTDSRKPAQDCSNSKALRQLPERHAGCYPRPGPWSRLSAQRLPRICRKQEKLRAHASDQTPGRSFPAGRDSERRPRSLGT